MAAAESGICDFGWQARPFELPGIDGSLWTLDRARGRKGLLVMFICNHCPYVRAIADRLAETCADLEALGIGSIAIMPNDTEAYPEDGLEGMKAFAAQHSFPFPYVIDESQTVARAYDAVCTPDFFGFDADLGLQYRGRLDASMTQLLDGVQNELFDAMRRVAETGHGPEDQVPSMGCSIKWRRAA